MREHNLNLRIKSRFFKMVADVQQITSATVDLHRICFALAAVLKSPSFFALFPLD